jgi:hypothetical protein
VNTGIDRKPGSTIKYGSPWYSWENNIKKDLIKMACGNVDRNHAAQDGVHWRNLMNAIPFEEEVNFLATSIMFSILRLKK